MKLDADWLKGRCREFHWFNAGDEGDPLGTRPGTFESADGKTMIAATDLYGIVVAEADDETAGLFEPMSDHWKRSVEPYASKEPRGVEVSLSALKAWCGPVAVHDECAACSGKGKVKCDRCDGEGATECECMCGHEHDAECGSCDGTGEIDCTQCADRHKDYGLIDGRIYDRALLAKWLEPFGDETVRLYGADTMAEVYGSGWRVFHMRVNLNVIGESQATIAEFVTGNGGAERVSFKAVAQ